ncbi:hypothetical protein BV401_38835 [Streptomyces malaysiensis subsp. malaysiensis]|uniref:Serine/threonine protein kinase n=1 Tax=Streptomyces autolyticus TaxID=75293 RepID=A0ABM6HRD2_9ACTN|nr:hypothetical protein BV401_38835 [Streptomyces autolyticus]
MTGERPSAAAAFRLAPELGIGAAHDGPAPTLDSLSARAENGPDPRDPGAGEGRGGTMRTDGTTVAAKLLLDPGASDGQAHGQTVTRADR